MECPEDCDCYECRETQASEAAEEQHELRIERGLICTGCDMLKRATDAYCQGDTCIAEDCDMEQLGEWHWGINSLGGDPGYHVATGDKSSPTEYIASVFKMEHAQLFAAAPDLFRALKRLRDFTSEYNGTEPNYAIMYKSVMQEVGRAIEKSGVK